MSDYLLDTHIWIWYVLGLDRVPEGLRSAIDEHSDRCWLSPASIWELGLLVERRRLALNSSLREWVLQATNVLPLKHAALTTEVALVSSEIDPALRDPGDRFIAGTALVYELALMTVDRTLVDAQWLQTLSA